MKDSRGLTALNIARVYEWSEAMQVLEAARKDARSAISEASPEDHNGEPAWKQIFLDAQGFADRHESEGVSDEQIMEMDPLGYSALHVAVETANERAVVVLLKDTRVDLNATNVNGQTAMHLAISYLGSEGQQKVMFQTVERLLENSDLAGLAIADHRGMQPLDCALHIGEMGVALRLIDKGAPISLPKDRIQRLFGLAIERNDALAVKRLLGAGAGVLDRCSNGKLPYEMASAAAAEAEVYNMIREAEQSFLGSSELHHSRGCFRLR